MCGRITHKSPPGELGLNIIDLIEDTYELPPPRYNGAPAQEHWVVRQHPETGQRTLGRLTWGLIPHWCKEASPKLKPINATAERVANAPMFRDAYARRRCILPVNSFFEWQAIKVGKAKQPHAVGMKYGEPFGLAGIWESWKHPTTGTIHRTFAVITCPANELLVTIHDRMPVILSPEVYDRWLMNIEPDPRDLLVPFPSGLMMMWPISTRVNNPENDDPRVLDPAEVANEPALF
jgi:putative SOS response-associated peptidase YedK